MSNNDNDYQKNKMGGDMSLNSKLYDYFKDEAENRIIKKLTIGLGYTCVLTDKEELGLSYTFFENKHGCSMISDFKNYEGENALNLLTNIKGEDNILRSCALALINALNFKNASKCESDKHNNFLIDFLNFKDKTKIAMVGDFCPIIKMLEKKDVELEVIDAGKGVGNKQTFDNKLKNWADVVVITSTSIINNTCESLLNKIGPNTRIMLLGPSTPMVMDIFKQYNVDMLCGFVPVELDKIQSLIRQGAGTPIINRHGRKIIDPKLF
ncbi:MAG: Rossmann-like domain-containing protein [Candidatus Muiribacteriota bacterium]